ncbi:MAG: hypothetical protein GMKNLPBB_00954 [Myxococcota bacterium]|nr:hypothetical protein [Myxococcota bacterium]
MPLPEYHSPADPVAALPRWGVRISGTMAGFMVSALLAYANYRAGWTTEFTPYGPYWLLAAMMFASAAYLPFHLRRGLLAALGFGAAVCLVMLAGVIAVVKWDAASAAPRAGWGAILLWLCFAAILWMTRPRRRW